MIAARRRTAAARAAGVLGVLGSMLLALLLAGVAAAPGAQAASYRYWTYWWGQPAATSWTFAQLGPASDRPKDGAVLGWRFAVATESGGRKAPRASLPFSSLCPALTSAPEGQKRVAVVVDYGSAADAPPGEAPPGAGTARVECVTVPSGANGVAVLGAAGVTLRFGDNGLVCGIDRYPRTECAAIVADPSPIPKPTSTKPRPSATGTTVRPTAPGADNGSVTSTQPAPSPSRSTETATASVTPSSTNATRPARPTSSATASPTDSERIEAPLPVRSGTPVASGTEAGSGGSPLAPIAGAVLVAVVGVGAWLTSRRRQA